MVKNNRLVMICYLHGTILIQICDTFRIQMMKLKNKDKLGNESNAYLTMKLQLLDLWDDEVQGGLLLALTGLGGRLKRGEQVN